TRQSHEGVRFQEHQVLALMHVLDHDQLMRLEQHMLASTQEGRDDPRDAAAMADDRSRDLAHEAEAATAIDEADISRRENASKVARGLDKSRVSARARAAIDADIPKVSRLLHGTHVHSGLCNVKEAYTLRSGGFLLGALGCGHQRGARDLALGPRR